MPDDTRPDPSSEPDEERRAKTWADLHAILSQVKWIGPGPEPSDDELMDMVVEEVHAMRAEFAAGDPLADESGT